MKEVRGEGDIFLWGLAWMQGLRLWLELIQPLRNLPSAARRCIPEDGMFIASWPDTTAIKAVSTNPFSLLHTSEPQDTVPLVGTHSYRADCSREDYLLDCMPDCLPARSDVTTRQCSSTSPLPKDLQNTGWRPGLTGCLQELWTTLTEHLIHQCKALHETHGTIDWIVSPFQKLFKF